VLEPPTLERPAIAPDEAASEAAAGDEEADDPMKALEESIKRDAEKR